MANAPVAPATGARTSLGHVRALDGVRGLAVAGVVLYHGGVAQLRGGFLGVDLFFVLSGFLITSLLVAELERRGRLSLARFYERRARRLLPALVVLVVLVVVLADQAMPHGSYPTLSTQVLGTMAYVGNWTLLAHHTNYFNLGLPPVPLQHTWSLAIEEQFYLVWPALVLGLVLALRRRARCAVACGAGAVGCAAATAFLYTGQGSVSTLYFETQTHVTTLLCGAALAFLVLRRVSDAGAGPYLRVPEHLAGAMSALGVLAWGVVLACFFAIGGTGPFLYRGGYLLFGLVVAAALAATVLDERGAAARVLAAPPLTALGVISYGVYLYHFPLFLWLDHGRTGLGGAALLTLRLAATLCVATVSYVVVERPVRERRLLRGVAGLLAGTGAYVATCVVAMALTASAATVPFADRNARYNFDLRPPQGTTTTILLVGDSLAQTLGNGLNDPTARAAHLFFVLNGNPSCSLVGGRLLVKDFRLDTPPRCAVGTSQGWVRRWSLTVEHHHPALSMMLYRLDLVDHRLDGRWQHVGDDQFDCTLHARLLRLAETLAVTGRPVVFLTTPYDDSGEQANGDAWPEDAPSRVRAYNAILERTAAAFPGVLHAVDLNGVVDPQGTYTRTIGRTVVRWVDGVHFTYAGDAYVLSRLLPALVTLAGETPPPASLRALATAARRAASTTCAAM